MYYYIQYVYNMYYYIQYVYNMYYFIFLQQLIKNQ